MRSGRSSGSGATPSPPGALIRSTSPKATESGRPCPSQKPPDAWTSWQTACWRSASARATRSASSREPASSGALFDFALALVGGVTAPIYANSSSEDCRYVLEPLRRRRRARRGRRAAREGRGGARRAAGPAPRADVLRPRGASDPWPRIRGREPDALAARRARVGEDDLFTFIYTSGTTGPPKACHDPPPQLLRDGDGHRTRWTTSSRRTTCCCSTCRSRTTSAASCTSWRRCAGYTIAFCADPYAVADALLKVRPTVFPSVPRIYEKVHTAVVAKFDEATGARRRLIDWALDVGRRVSLLRQQGRPIPRGLAIQHRLADRLVYSKVKERLGGRLRIAPSRAVPRSQSRSSSSSTRSTSSSSRRTA